ncbi:hypothetical protein R3W88_023152 [Solanum pinnatisectum]|uniref:SURP motif domain-containing protein n=1 Tax=Solanum pinnatisectum TaxID=50273 RepID=A0AAV9LWN4_9SOLN|nr:hypothetical protein R3W88_023152 [Solanum pinnatisectum]
MSAQKKTPFQKHREEEEAKKKRAEDETARLYQEFVESFQVDNTPGSKAFVRGGTINPNDKLKMDSEGGKSKDEGSGLKKGSRSVPSFLPPPMATKGRDHEKKEDKPREKEKGKARNIDNFMEELKHEQEMREKHNQPREQWRDRHTENSAQSSRFDELPDDFDPSGRPRSFDDGDTQTTNLYVGNLSPQVRTEEERRQQSNCGFVSFMNRADAQATTDEMEGVTVNEYELKIGWGKSVSLPSQALPVPPPRHMAIRSKEGATVILSGPSGPPVTTVPGQNTELVLTPNVPDIMVVPPEDDHLCHVIDTMAPCVLDGGCAFEQAIMERGRGNPLVRFLFELGSKEHTYYVWRLYSFAQGDTLQWWRTVPFIMITGSGRWIPPSLPTPKGADHEKEAGSTYAAGRSRRVEVERTLTDAHRDEFEDMLHSLTLERSQIKEAMGFALDNADAAGEERVLKVLQVWADWFLFSDAYVNGLRATFLQTGNSGVTPFHSLCGDAPEVEQRTSSDDAGDGGKVNPDGALAIGKGAAMKELLSLPLTELERRCRHNGLSIVGGKATMVARFLYLEDAEKQRGHELDEDLKFASHSSSARFPSTQKDSNLELDRMAPSKRNSQVASDVQLKQKESVSSPLTNSAPHYKSIDFSSEGKNETILPTSKWAREDDEQKRSSRDLGLTYSFSGSENAGDGLSKIKDAELTTGTSNSAYPGSGMTEELRQNLRRLVALIEYLESLEERGIKSSDELSVKLKSIGNAYNLNMVY